MTYLKIITQNGHLNLELGDKIFQSPSAPVNVQKEFINTHTVSKHPYILYAYNLYPL